MFIVAIVGLIVAIAAFVIYYMQWQELSNQTSLLAEQANRSVIENVGNSSSFRQQLKTMQDQVNAARQSTEAINKQMRLDERPWFGISDFEVLQYNIDDANTPFKFQIFFKNTGKTPARNVDIAGVFQVYKDRFAGPTTNDWNAFLKYFSTAKERYVTAPNATRKLITDTSGTAASNDMYVGNHAAIRQGKAYLYFFGQATYLDINDGIHTTKFCLFLADSKNKQLAHCGSGNTMN